MILPVIVILFLIVLPNVILIFFFDEYLVLLPSLLVIISIITILVSYRIQFIRLLYSMVLFFELPKFIFASAVLIGTQIEKIISGAYLFFLILAIIFDVCIFFVVFYGFFFGWKHLVVRPYNFSFKNLPNEFDNYKIIQISDLHLGSFITSVNIIEKLVEKINEIQADIIVFTGDLINLSPLEITPFKNILKKINQRNGIFAVLGNHDYCIYGQFNHDKRKIAVEEVKNHIKSLGWKLLLNENKIINKNNDSIAIIGVENDSPHYNCSFGDLKTATKNLPNKIFKILLAHDPTFWRRKVLPESNIDLTLSGHTHAMQLKIGRFTPSKWRFPEWGGAFCQNGRKLLVSLGIGGSVAFRFGAWPEIDIITLHKS